MVLFYKNVRPRKYWKAKKEPFEPGGSVKG